MDKLIISICLLAWMSSCAGGKKTDNGTVGKDTVCWVDAVSVELWEEEEGVMPEFPDAADESFADFLYNFMLDEHVQQSRIVFPLLCMEENRTDSIEEASWLFDPLLNQLDFYTLLYDREADMELEKNASPTSVKVQWYYFSSGKRKDYRFERMEGEWKLASIEERPFPKPKRGCEDFFRFYERFVNDSLFQAQRLANSLKYVTTDPEDEFRVLESFLMKEQWKAFKPDMLKECLTNIDYGQKLDSGSDQRIVEMKGVGDGYSNTLYFRCRDSKWYLVQFDDLGN